MQDEVKLGSVVLPQLGGPWHDHPALGLTKRGLVQPMPHRIVWHVPSG